MVVESAAPARGSTQSDMHTPFAVPPSHPHPRRPRVREVSSRFMSPVTSSYSGDLHTLADKSPLPKHTAASPSDLRGRQQHHSRTNCVKRRSHQDFEPLCSTDLNRPETVRSMDNPFSMAPVPRKQRAVVKLFKENDDKREQQHHPDTLHPDISKFSRKIGGARPDTPMLGTMTRNPPAKLRLQRSTDSGMASAAISAAKLLQSSGLSSSTQTSNDFSQISSDSVGCSSSVDDNENGSIQNVSHEPTSSDCSRPNSCPSSPVPIQRCRTRPQSLMRSSSLPESDKLLTVFNGSGSSTSCRSLNLQLPNSDNSLQHSAALLSKSHANSLKPPQPMGTKLASDTRKVKKATSQLEEVHSLKLLYNRYLQWRFVNAKAETSVNAQRRQAEGSLYSVVIKILELSDLVRRKCTELGMLRRIKSLYTIVEAQTPYLDDWGTLEEEYLTSLSEVIQALVSASVQLPIGGNIKADLKGIDDALHSAVKVVQMIASHTEYFMPKAIEVDTLSSQLAKYNLEERVLVAECGDLLTKTYISQVEECCLKSQLIQQYRKPITVAGRCSDKS